MVCDLKHIAFTGNSATGSKIMTAGAQNVKVFLSKIMFFIGMNVALIKLQIILQFSNLRVKF